MLSSPSDAETIYDVPNLMLDEGLDVVVLKKLDLKTSTTNLSSRHGIIF